MRSVLPVIMFVSMSSPRTITRNGEENKISGSRECPPLAQMPHSEDCQTSAGRLVGECVLLLLRKLDDGKRSSTVKFAPMIRAASSAVRPSVFHHCSGFNKNFQTQNPAVPQRRFTNNKRAHESSHKKYSGEHGKTENNRAKDWWDNRPTHKQIEIVIWRNAASRLLITSLHEPIRFLINDCPCRLV